MLPLVCVVKLDFGNINFITLYFLVREDTLIETQADIQDYINHEE